MPIAYCVLPIGTKAMGCERLADKLRRGRHVVFFVVYFPRAESRLSDFATVWHVLCWVETSSRLSFGLSRRTPRAVLLVKRRVINVLQRRGDGLGIDPEKPQVFF